MNIKNVKRGGSNNYELSFKRKLCEELLSGQITAAALARKYQMPKQGRTTIIRWLKWYQQEQAELLSSLPMAHKPEPVDNGDKDKAELQKELALAKAKIATLETMIDIAEEQFKIEIRKKSGTKPSLE